MLNMGPGRVLGGYRYSTPPGPPQSHHTPGTPLPPALPGTPTPVLPDSVNKAVGLKSVAQLTLSVQISDIRGITEVYNLALAGRINNHFLIPGNE